MAIIPKRKVDDYGEKIGGARKDRWKTAAMTAADLDDLTVEEAAKFVSKDLIWPLPDYAAFAEQGYEPDALALMKVVRDSIPKTPDLTLRNEAGQQRSAKAIHADYIRMVTLIRDHFAASKTKNAVLDLETAIFKAIEWNALGGWRDHSKRQLLDTVRHGRVEPFRISIPFRRRARKLVDDGFPTTKVAAWLKGVRIVPDPRPSAKGTFVAVRSGKILTEGCADAEAAEAALKAAWEEARADNSKKLKMPPMYRERNAAIERSGLADKRDGSDVTPQAFVDQFGFRAVEFGEWLPDGERQLVLNHAYDALCDLADVLEIPEQTLGLGGRIAISFGSRGSGRPAHYEPERKVMNISRLSGSGSLAHEWAHALDHIIGLISQTNSLKPISGRTPSCSGWYDWSLPRNIALTGLGPDLSESWNQAVDALIYRRRGREEEIDCRREALAARVETRAREAQRLEDYRANPRAGSTFERRMLSWLAHFDGTTKRLEREVESFVKTPLATGSLTNTDYFDEAKKLCGPSGDYWQRPTEMFARAAESAVFDKLQERGARSDFLVEGVEENRYSGMEWKGNPYPTGGDRRSISAAILAAIKQSAPLLVREDEIVDSLRI